MALYAALTFWLLVIMFSAWGVHRIWSGLVRPRIVNSILLPGTLIAQLGHVLGLLVTGASVQNTKLMGDDEEGEPESSPPDRHRVPIVGPIVVGLLPLVACAAGLAVAVRFLGQDVIRNLGPSLLLPQSLPTSLAGVWALLHDAIDLLEGLVDAILRSPLLRWETALFLYLAICLTVRMAPFEGNRRGAIGAIFLAAIVIAVLASLLPAARDMVERSWPLVSFAVGMLLLLLVLSLVVAGVIGLVRTLVKRE